MNARGGWLEKRRRIRADLAVAFSARTAVSRLAFLRVFYDASALPTIREFRDRYIPDAATLEEILASIAARTGLAAGAARRHLSGGDTFPRFGERLLRAGAYAAEAR